MALDHILVLTREPVTCPHCAHAFELHEGIARQTIERHHEALEQQTKALREELAEEVRRDLERKAAQQYGAAINELQAQLCAAKRLELQAREAIDKARVEAREQALADQQIQMRLMQEDLQRKGDELQKLRELELDLRKQRQALQEQQRTVELQIQRRLDEERDRLAQQIADREAQRYRLVEAEHRKKLEDVQRMNDELRRKLEQGSQQLQGEVLELHIEQSLASSFFQDVIEEVKKGQRGADVVQVVRTSSGDTAGRIIWEAKRAENWSDRWLQKLKDDQQEAKADLAVLVTTCLPRGMTGPFARVGDVWVVTPAVLRPVAETLRVILLQAHQLRQANTSKGERIELLYNYLSSPVFAQRMRSVLDAFATMQADLESEKRAFHRIWAKRQEQINRVTISMNTVVGELQGIAQDSLPELVQFDDLEALGAPVEASNATEPD